MNKKITAVLILMLVLPALSGCLEGDEQIEHHIPSSSNSAPVPIIDAPEKAYFEEIINFDASKSYDIDGTIESYEWDFGDNETAEGVQTTHVYKLESYFNIEFPVTYSVLLKIVDNNGSWEYITHDIMLYPKEYIFYLDHESLINKKPSSNMDVIRTSFGKLSPPHELTYKLSSSITIQPCTWNATIHIKKPKFTLVNRISLAFYNKTGERIIERDSSFKLFDVWDERIISITGKIIKSEEFKSIKLTIYGFSLQEKISIIYGSETPSTICFDFTI